MPLNAMSAGFVGLLLPDGVMAELPAFGREAVLRALALAASARLGLPAMLVHDRLRSREALGSTAFGGGAAIPHARLDGLDQSVAMLARLPQPIDWQASDGQPVDIVVLLLSPENNNADHLKALARISRTLRDPATVPALRAATTVPAMLAAIAGDVQVIA
jgi:PTS system nitrogen regulatory IIA component